MKRNFGMMAATSFIALAVWAPAFAQEAAPQPSEANEDAASASDEIIVTGSRIRGIAPVGSNVIALSADKIASEPVTSTNDLLRRVPQVVSLGANRNGGTAQNGAANATRGAGINLRGIGTNATLLLYDGKRLPPQGTQGQYTDPSAIPAIALERVEVVADGASAIYGSDAIAGVVNFILRRNFDGIEMRARAGIAEGGYEEHQVAGIIGKKWNGGSAMVAADFTHNAALRGWDLPFYQDNNLARGGRDLRVSNCNPGTISVGGSTYAIPAGGVTPANASALVAGTSNKCFFNRLDSVIPEQDRYNVTAAISQELAPGIKLMADGFYSYRKGKIAGINNVSATVPSSNPFYVTPVGVTPPLCAASVGAPAGARCETVLFSLIPDVGAPDYNPYHGKTWNVSAGIQAQLFGDFRATAYYAHGESEDVADRRLGINAAALAAALRDTNPATALNVFGGRNNPDTIAKIRDNLFVIVGRTKLDVANLQLDGPVAQLPGGAMRVAVGGEWRKEYTFTDLITGRQAAQTHVADGGSRTVKAVFGELFVPIFGPENATGGMQQLSLSVAGRYEDYSDFGHTANPKIGLTWKPVDQITIKGSYGKSFRAPTFTEVSTIAGGAGLYYDTLPGPSGNLVGIGIAGGNRGLKPETARTWSAGIEVAPVSGLRATATYFDIDYKDQIQALRGTPNLLINPLYASFVQFNPTAAQVTALINSGLPINQVINQNAVQFIADGRRQNLGRSLVRGLDFGIYYNRQFDGVTLDMGFQGTYFTKYLFTAVPGATPANVVGTIGFPQKFRSQGDIGLKAGVFSGRFVWNHLAAYLNPGSTLAPKVSSYDTFDLSVGVEANEHLRIAFDVRNLFNRYPPFVDTLRGYDPQSASPIPRMFSLSAQAKF